jgi:iron(III) transport system ATP-binding protein
MLSVENLSISYEQKQVVSDVSFFVHDEILCLLGQSGSGKSSILKAIAGLLPIDSGVIKLNDTVLASDTQLLPPEQRHLGMIFQDYALFPHLSVLENIAFGIDLQLTKAERHDKASAVLAMVNMMQFADRYPHQLSGGQQQRVAIARAVASQPKLLLLDEPFSNIDQGLSQQLMLEMKELIKQQQIPAIFVTHSKEEAFIFSDRLGFIEDGKIVQHGIAEELYFQPQTPSLANAMSQGNWLDVDVVDSLQTQSPILGTIKSTHKHGKSQGEKLKQFIHACHINVQRDDKGTGKVIQSLFYGDFCLNTVAVDGDEILGVSTNHANIQVGMKVTVTVNPHDAVLFDL